MIAASIDIGTNTTRLLIAEVASGGSYGVLTRRAVITRLGEGVSRAGLFTETAIERTEKVLEDYHREIKELSAEKIWVVATSAAREARNCAEFLKRVEERFGWKVWVLSGEEEARLSFLGAASVLLPQTEGVVMDIGGGSTEIILGKNRNMLGFCSLDIGSVRLTEVFVRTDPPSPDELGEISNHVREKLAEVPKELSEAEVSHGVGIAGTITSLSAVKQRMEVYDTERIHGSVLTLHDVQSILDLLVSLPLEKRTKVIGLDPKRADVIVAGTLILIEVMRAFRLQEITVSERDILDGILIDRAKSEVSDWS
jgi:exopolyphosphatase/guanosine-5'-triphosphate,3'-diphosphate pyrophosphatase